MWLSEIYTSSMEDSLVPSEIIKAIISPHWKGGEKSNPANYRPVALTSHLSKIMERVVKKAVVNYLLRMLQYRTSFCTRMIML